MTPWQIAQHQLEQAYYGPLDQTSGPGFMTPSFQGEKMVRLRHYFGRYFILKAPRFAKRLMHHLDKEAIARFMGDFIVSPEYRAAQPARLFEGSARARTLRYHQTSMWPIVDYLARVELAPPAIQQKLLSNAILDAVAFSHTWHTEDGPALLARGIPYAGGLGVRESLVILELPVEPDLTADLVPPESGTPVFYAVDLASPPGSLDMVDVTAFVLDPVGHLEAAREAGLLVSEQEVAHV